MSYNIQLVDPITKQCVEVPSCSEGGTQVIGGSSDADLNITFNYSAVYRLLNFHPTDLKGRTGKEAIPILEELVKKLGTNQWEDYWAPTPGNAGHAMNVLLGWAKLHPDAIFESTG